MQFDADPGLRVTGPGRSYLVPRYTDLGEGLRRAGRQAGTAPQARTPGARSVITGSHAVIGSSVGDGRVAQQLVEEFGESVVAGSGADDRDELPVDECVKALRVWAGSR